jgi:hypothetical protein
LSWVCNLVNLHQAAAWAAALAVSVAALATMQATGSNGMYAFPLALASSAYSEVVNPSLHQMPYPGT